MAAKTPAGEGWQPQFFNEQEWAFINAAVARLIPADELGPGAREAGVEVWSGPQPPAGGRGPFPFR